MSKLLLLVATVLVACLAASAPAFADETNHYCRDHDGHRNWVVTPDCPGVRSAGETSGAYATGNQPPYRGADSEAAAGGSVESIIRATWPDNEEDLAIAVASCESGLNPAAINPSSGAKGLFQFLPSTAASAGASYAALSDPYTASLAAARLQDASGWSPWVACV